MQGSLPVRPPILCLIRALSSQGKDRYLVLRAQDGDIEAFGSSSNVIRTPVRTAYMIVRNRHDSEDIVQETLVQAWRSLHLLRDPDAFRGWLMRICTNKATSTIRQLQRRATDPYDSEGLESASVLPNTTSTATDDPAQSSEVNAQIEALAKLLASAPEELRIVWVLREVDDMSYEEISQTLNLTESTVRGTAGTRPFPRHAPYEGVGMSSTTRIPHAEPRHTKSAQSYELDEASTREYLRLIASLHKTWDTLESQSSASVMPQRHMMDAVIAETRHGAQVEMPPTDLGPYSMSEFSLRALVRRSVDSVPGARALKSSFKHAPAPEGQRELGIPDTIFCRISAHVTTSSLPQLAQQVRDAVRQACYENLELSPTVNIHIEDLHDDD